MDRTRRNVTDHLARRRWLIGGMAAAVLLGAVAAIAVLVLSIGSDTGKPGANPEDVRQVALGQQVYQAHCAACHGAGLEGQPNWQQRLPSSRLPAPPHDATGHTWHHPDRQLFEITRDGIEAFAPPGYESDMPAFGATLTDEEIWAVLAYIKSTWPPAIQQRQAEISRTRRE